MKAAFYTKYGPPDVLHIREVEKPTPKDNEVLIRTYAASVTMGDCELRSFTFPTWIWLPLRIVFGVRKPKRSIPGFYLSGEIESVGESVKRFTKGDQVYGITGLNLPIPSPLSNDWLRIRKLTFESESLNGRVGSIVALELTGFRRRRMVAVGGRLPHSPPHRSRRALLTHRAPVEGRT